MQLMLMVDGQEGVTWEQWRALAAAAEDAGLAGLFSGDHYSSFGEPDVALDAWTALAALAPLTRTLRLGTLVSPVGFRHPSVLARVAATVDHVSGGRAELGMGTGWFEPEHVKNGFTFLPLPERFDHLVEQVEVVVRSWTVTPFDHAGARYELRGQHALPRPRQEPHPPLIVGGLAKPRSTALAARFAQEYNHAMVAPEAFAQRRASVERACAQAGRDPATMRHSLFTTAVLGDDRAQLRERMAAMLPRQGFEKRRDAEAVIDAPPEGWLVGTVEQAATRLAQYTREGCTRVYLKHVDHHDVDAVATMGALAQAVGGR